MEKRGLYGPLRIVSWVVVLAMAAAIGYAGGISVVHWSGIGV
jgi:hypothetical protein